MKQNVVRYRTCDYGENIGFYVVAEKRKTRYGSEDRRKTSLYNIIRCMSRPQNWSEMIPDMVKSTHKGTTTPSTKKRFSRTKGVISLNAKP